MKRLFLILLLSTPILCWSQSLPKDSAPKSKVNKYKKTSLFQEVETIQELIFNVTASFQMFARDSTSSAIYRPIVFIDNKPYNDDSYPNIDFKEIKHFEIIKSYDGGYFINSENANISIIIQTKN
jgi:hypothetical protein